ncbi:uncharacterized protein LOC127250462 [Andrographis paniculata]|uniref:uncharacterized protein LOC127250462 n=1 Tax=Andrographis paniculata TaxID=175694 RepID=UPI0021E73A95|nr:uncharacterized protein LOC127250462 [Andrographis paniculata]
MPSSSEPGKPPLRLHNFNLPPELQWKKHNTRKTAGRHPMKSRARRSSAMAKGPSVPAKSVSNLWLAEKTSSRICQSAAGHSATFDPTSESAERNKTLCETYSSPSKPKTKIIIKIKLPPTRDKADVLPNLNPPAQADQDISEDFKTWNMRPRKPLQNKSSLSDKKEKTEPSLSLLSPPAKRKLSITVPLTTQEVEKDILLMTGGRPSQRPKKRPKHLQKYLNILFPGGCLAAISVDKYKV